MVVGGPAYGESSKVMNFSPANATCIMHMQEKKKRKINKPENGGGGFICTVLDAQTKIFSLLPNLPPPPTPKPPTTFIFGKRTAQLFP